MNYLTKILTGIGISLFASTATAATILNGSFEDPLRGGSFTRFDTGPNANAITGWTVGSGSIDLVNTLWIAQDGAQAIDLDGTEVGSIYQDIMGLVSGVEYTISFWMSGNDFDGQDIKTMDVSVGGTTTGFSFDTAVGGGDDGVWEQNFFTFVATAMTERLTFQSTTTGSATAFGAAIDNVSFLSPSAIPLPATGLLLVGGFGGLAMIRRRRSKK